MSIVYKVWIEIEHCDEEKDEYISLDAPDAAVATFDSYREAWDFAEKLQHHGYVDAGDWPEWAGRKAAKRKQRRADKRDGPVIHFATKSDADERVHMGPALCQAGRAQRTEQEQYVAGDWAFVTCKRCQRLLAAHNKREDQAEVQS